MPSSCKKTVHLFDCDGVILDSNKLKITALEFSLNSVGCSADFTNWAIEEFRLNFGRTREKFFKILEKNNSFNNCRFTSEMSHQAINLYAERVMSLYLKCEIIDETYEYLSQLPFNHSVFVVSASDQAELRSILPSRIPRFDSVNIFGGPKEKAENIRSILELCGPEGVVFYGDSVKDGLAAVANDVYFCGLTKYSADPEALVSFCRKWNANFYEHCMQISL